MFWSPFCLDFILVNTKNEGSHKTSFGMKNPTERLSSSVRDVSAIGAESHVLGQTVVGNETRSSILFYFMRGLIHDEQTT